VDARQVDSIGIWQYLAVKLGPANDHDLFLFAGSLHGGLDGVHNYTAIRCIARVAGDHDIGSAGQGAADGLIGLAAHQDWLAHGGLPEMLQVSRQVPG
jgi:hypothetical protein